MKKKETESIDFSQIEAKLTDLGIKFIEPYIHHYKLSKRGKARSVMFYPKANTIIVEFKGGNKKKVVDSNISQLIYKTKEHIKCNFNN